MQLKSIMYIPIHLVLNLRFNSAHAAMCQMQLLHWMLNASTNYSQIAKTFIRLHQPIRKDEIKSKESKPIHCEHNMRIQKLIAN